MKETSVFREQRHQSFYLNALSFVKSVLRVFHSIKLIHSQEVSWVTYANLRPFLKFISNPKQLKSLPRQICSVISSATKKTNFKCISESKKFKTLKSKIFKTQAVNSIKIVVTLAFERLLAKKIPFQ